LHPLDRHPGVDRDAESLGRGAQLRDRILVDRVEEPRQRFEDRDLGAGAGIDMGEFEGDHAAADKDDARRQAALAQDVVGGDQQFGAGKRQRARRGAGRDHDVLGLQGLVADGHRVRADKAAAAADHLDAAALHQPTERPGNRGDHGPFPVDHRHLEPGLARRHGDPYPGIAAAQDHDIEALDRHGFVLPECRPRTGPLPAERGEGRGEGLFRPLPASGARLCRCRVSRRSRRRRSAMRRRATLAQGWRRLRQPSG
jgi:hypothetical protein